jgi:hypothetical protein
MVRKTKHALFFILTLVCGVSSMNGLSSTKAGFNAGLVMPEQFDATIGAGGLMDFGFDLGQAGSIHVQPTAELWYASDDQYIRIGNTYYGWSDFEMSINPIGRYYFPIPPAVPVKPFVGMGLAFVMSFYHIDNDYPDPVPSYLDDDDFDLGMNFVGGIDFAIGSRATGFVEMRGKIDGTGVFKLLFGMMFPIGGSY